MYGGKIGFLGGLEETWGGGEEKKSNTFSHSSWFWVNSRNKAHIFLFCWTSFGNDFLIS
jgi:hypothetical protein